MSMTTTIPAVSEIAQLRLQAETPAETLAAMVSRIARILDLAHGATMIYVPIKKTGKPR